MSKKYEFTTTRWQYLFNSAVKNLEISFITAIGAVVANLVNGLFSQEISINVGQIILTFMLMMLGISVFSVGYYWVKIKLLKSNLPTLVIDDNGILLDELGEKKEFSWSEVTGIAVQGFFKKIIRLNENKRSTIYVIDYYLFEPEQRVEILRLLESRVGDKYSP